MTCASYDYIEMACMFGYEVELFTKEGASIIGLAKTTKNINKVEHIVMITQGEERLVDLNSLNRIKVLTPNARFTDEVLA